MVILLMIANTVFAAKNPMGGGRQTNLKRVTIDKNSKLIYWLTGIGGTILTGISVTLGCLYHKKKQELEKQMVITKKQEQEIKDAETKAFNAIGGLLTLSNLTHFKKYFYDRKNKPENTKLNVWIVDESYEDKDKGEVKVTVTYGEKPNVTMFGKNVMATEANLIEALSSILSGKLKQLQSGHIKKEDNTIYEFVFFKA